MKTYEIEYSYTTRIGETITVPASDLDFAEVEALNYIHNTYADVENVQIESIVEVPSRVLL